jgi:hypothetical protein
VRRGLTRLLEDSDRDWFTAALFLQLRQPECRRHSGRPAADDEDVDFQRFARHRPLTTKTTKRWNQERREHEARLFTAKGAKLAKDAKNTKQ